MKDSEDIVLKITPNFAAWSNKNLADFAVDAHIKMQELEWELEQERRNTKAALKMARKLLMESDSGTNPGG
jgi:hypothetical protein